MKKFVVLTSLLLIGLLLLTGCSKDKVTDTVDNPVATTLDTQLATTADALYGVTKVGVGAGTTNFGVRGRTYVGSTMTGLGEANDTTGEYTVADPGMPGVTCTLKFLHGIDVVYFNMAGAFGTNNDTLQLYSDTDLTASKILVTDVPQDQTAAALFPRYIPSMFSKLTDNKPISWFTITAPGDMVTMETDLNAFINSNFPDSMVNRVSGTVGGATISLALTSTMTDKPTDLKPATMIGGGTITLSTGEVLTIVSNVTVGASGPIGGTQTFSSTSGLSGTMTFKADKTMDGTVSKDGVLIANIHINVDGTGTLTDVITGAVTTI